MTVVLLTSLTRISDLHDRPYDVRRLPREDWAGGDYVVGEISPGQHRAHNIELASGRMVQTLTGDHVIGAFGNRAATLEGVGSWSSIADDRMQAMTSAGLFGAMTSRSKLMPPLTELTYVGHVTRGDRKVCMSEFALGSGNDRFNVPTVLLAGTSMSAGKTTTGRIVVHELEKLGKKVVGAKLTGAGRYRDILSFRDAGAHAVFDFVDAGMPSTVVPEDHFVGAIRPLLHFIDGLEPDFLVAEAGASPLEPYNGAAAIRELGDNIKCRILCASDPYAVVGVEKAFGLEPDVVTGPATSTSAAIDLVRKLAGVDAVNVLETGSSALLREVLERTLGVGPS